MALYNTLNDEQKVIFDKCIDGRDNILCTGVGGTGKTYLLNAIIERFKSDDIKKTVAVTASTGVAAYGIGGITVHKFAGVGIPSNDITDMIKKARRGASYRYWRDTDILIIDEISMLQPSFFDILFNIAQAIRQSTSVFGGIRLLVFGDFLQLPPVSKDAQHTFVFETPSWNKMNFKVVQLGTIMRQQDNEFGRVLSSIRLGKSSSQIEEFISSLSRDVPYNDGIDAVRLFSLKKLVEEYNTAKLDQITKKIYSYRSRDTGDIGTLRQCPAQNTLNLKEGAQVMIIRNLSTNIVNGSLGRIVGFKYLAGSFYPEVDITMRDGSITRMIISNTTWETRDPMGKVTSCRVQIPLIHAWAITIHKSQGQSIPRLYVDMNGIFEYGQAYVALSRAIDPTKLQVVNFSTDKIKVNHKAVEFYNRLDTQEGDATNVALTTSSTWDPSQVSLQEAMSDLAIKGDNKD